MLLLYATKLRGITIKENKMNAISTKQPSQNLDNLINQVIADVQPTIFLGLGRQLGIAKIGIKFSTPDGDTGKFR